MNPFWSLYKECNAGPPVADFPIMLDLELTSSCNMRCAMCPTGLHTLGRPAGFMQEPVFAAIIEQVQERGTALRFIGWGEPMLHPQLVEFVAEASANSMSTHLNTNGTKLTRGLAGELMMAGLKSLKFSFQGVDRESYLAMRKMDHFEELLACIRMMVDVRDQRVSPWIAVSTTTTDESAERIKLFRDGMNVLVDEVSLGKTIFDFLEQDKEPVDTDLVHPEPCQEIWHKLAISYTGDVRICCNDYSGVTDLGNVLTTPIAEMWHHPVLEDYRERTDAGLYDQPLCNTCYTYLERRD